MSKIRMLRQGERKCDHRTYGTRRKIFRPCFASTLSLSSGWSRACPHRCPCVDDGGLSERMIVWNGLLAWRKEDEG